LVILDQKLFRAKGTAFYLVVVEVSDTPSACVMLVVAENDRSPFLVVEEFHTKLTDDIIDGD
jgi:hypothetical protein